MEWLYFLVGGVIVVIVVLILAKYVTNSSNFTTKVSSHSQYTAPKRKKVGVITSSIKFRTSYIEFDVKYSARIIEIKRYNDKVEVEYVDLLNTNSVLGQSYDSDILAFLKRTKKLVDYKDIEWEFNAPDILLDRDMFREFINKGEIKVYGIEIRIDEDIERSELLDIIINERYGKD